MMFGYNFELAWRGLRHHPRTTLLVVLTMALGLASAMTTLTLLHVLSSDPLPGISPHLYMGWVDSRQLPKAGGSTTGNASGMPSHLKLADAQALLTAHRAPAQVMLTEVIQSVQNESGGKTQSEVGIAASSELFPMFGIELLHGRYWTPAEDAAHAPVVVVSAGLSRELFGTQNSVGRTLRVGGKPFRVIGVSAKWAPQPHFYGLDLWAFSSNNADSLFLPVGALLDAGLGPFTSGGCDDDTPLIFGKVNVPHCRWLSLWVQLNDAAQVAGYRQFLMDYASQQHGAGRFERPPHAELYSVPAWLDLNHVVPDNVRLNVWLAGGFLLLCMVNVAGLLAARFLRRSVEIGVRRALGAPRQAIFAQCVWEAGMAGMLGGVLALPLTGFGLWVVRRQRQGYTDLAHLDPLTFAGLFGLALVVGLLVGMLPAWRACCVEPGLQVKSA